MLVLGERGAAAPLEPGHDALLRSLPAGVERTLRVAAGDQGLRLPRHSQDETGHAVLDPCRCAGGRPRHGRDRRPSLRPNAVALGAAQALHRTGGTGWSDSVARHAARRRAPPISRLYPHYTPPTFPYISPTSPLCSRGWHAAHRCALPARLPISLSLMLFRRASLTSPLYLPSIFRSTPCISRRRALPAHLRPQCAVPSPRRQRQ